MRKPPPGRAGVKGGGGVGGQGEAGGQGEEDQEEGTSWMADHARSHHDSKISPDPRDDYDFLEVGQFRKPLQRQLEEAVRIKTVMKQGFIVLGQGPKARKLKLKKILLNRKMEKFSPWFLTMGGGEIT